MLDADEKECMVECPFCPSCCFLVRVYVRLCVITLMRLTRAEQVSETEWEERVREKADSSPQGKTVSFLRPRRSILLSSRVREGLISCCRNLVFSILVFSRVSIFFLPLLLTTIE